MNQTFDNILKVQKLNNAMQSIQNYKDKRNYKAAYYKAAAMLEFINANLVMRKFKINIDDTDIIKFIEIYNEKDKILSKKMISINGEYNSIDNNEITEEDLNYLLFKIDEIIEYIINEYGAAYVA